MNVDGGWEFWIDRGGTFTDIVARTPRGEIETLKLLSMNPGRYEDAAVAGVSQLLSGAPIGERHVAAVKMGTTVATNALLERRGEPTVLVITAGFEDAIRIGGQQRPDIFALDIRLPEMLYTRVIGVTERITAGGAIETPLDAVQLKRDLAHARDAGLRSVAIVLLHGYRYPQHEAAAEALARDLGFAQISVSHRVLPLPKLVVRGDTTLADAYLSPVLDRYVASVRRGLAAVLGDAPLLFMQSHGGLAAADHFRGKDSLLSGPAGGVVGMVHAARAVGVSEVIGFDMGGTSTDVALYAGELERTTDAVIAAVRISAPMLSINTVAAGGGSVLTFGGGRLRVGPESAGAHPGPACYRNGGPLTVTDANVLLGRVQPEFFPHVFGPAGNEALDATATANAFSFLAAKVAEATGEPRGVDELAAGFLKIAVERMANAIKQISVQRGHDVTRFALCSFGGAGGQHAAQVADALGVRTVLIHPLSGVLSAYGIGVADLRVVQQRAVEVLLDSTLLATLATGFSALADAALTELRAQGGDVSRATFEHRVRLKVAGADTSLAVTWELGTTLAALRRGFDELHARHFGFQADAQAALVAESVELEAVVANRGDSAEPAHLPRARGRPPKLGTRRLWCDGGWYDAPVYRRDALLAGATVRGPALIVEPHATTVVEPGWRATVHANATLVLTRARVRPRREVVAAAGDPVMLEVFNNLFMHVAEEMGIVLEHTAHSVNIKERLDFSCAVFAADGALIANAPHIPVHLGSMGDSVQSILHTHRPARGDSYLLNSPYAGGTHLPDMTVVTPVFDPSGKRLRYLVASRAHHADVGGRTPGSMPPDSHSIDEEGVLADGVRIVAAGEFLETEVRALLASGPYPARNPDQNIADFKAQLAANARGVLELDRLTRRFGVRTVTRYMGHVRRNAADCVRAAIDRLRDGTFRVELDGGEHIEVAVTIDHAAREAMIDFAGTSAQSAGNFNAPSSIVRAAVLYVFRTFVHENIPLNAGCMEPLTIRLPRASLLSPAYPAAVVAGNVETSQCITDALLAALDACAAAQGTMNNFTFGNARHQYYETVCGGAGAGPTFDGASAVHTHMTNSRLTDPEVLEQRHPVRLRRFAIRRGSGGRGAHHGGDGIVRDIEFLEPMQAAILANRRRVPPFGLRGGEPGQCGRNFVVRANGRVEDLPATAAVDLAAGDRFVIETPGGGGYGAPS
ncbi:MAG: hydantoinase B/oxoprolinase family protein [Gammaproteobacteria bacterium]